MDRPPSTSSFSSSSSLPTFVEAAVDDDSDFIINQESDTTHETARYVSQHISANEQDEPIHQSEDHANIECDNENSVSRTVSRQHSADLNTCRSRALSRRCRYNPYPRLHQRRHSDGDTQDLLGEAGLVETTNNATVEPVYSMGGLGIQVQGFNVPENIFNSQRDVRSKEIQSNLIDNEMPSTSIVHNNENGMHIEVRYQGRKVAMTHAHSRCAIYYKESPSDEELEKFVGQSGHLKLELPSYESLMPSCLHHQGEMILGNMTKLALILECDKGNIYVTRLCKPSLFFVSENYPEQYKIQRGNNRCPLRALIYNFTTHNSHRRQQGQGRVPDPAVYIHVGQSGKRYGEQPFIMLKIIPCKAFTDGDCCT